MDQQYYLITYTDLVDTIKNKLKKSQIFHFSEYKFKVY